MPLVALRPSTNAILGYFFGQFSERLPSSSDTLVLLPGDADIIGVCSLHGLRGGVWPAIANDPRPWTIPVFREIEPATGIIKMEDVQAAEPHDSDYL